MSREVDLKAALGIVRREKWMKTTTANAAMKTQGMQLWRPKVKAQCVATDVGTVEANDSSNTGSLDQLTSVFENHTANKVEESKFSASLEVNQSVYQSIKAKRGKLKRKIETESSTSLSFSRQKSRCYIVVEGFSDEAVQHAARLLQPLMNKEDAKDVPVTENAGISSNSTIDAATRKPVGTRSLQWMPKAVRTMHTVADECKTVTIESSEGELISGSILVDKKLQRLVKGHKNEVKERIEKETGTTISFGNPVVVEGPTEDSVRKALEEIQKVVDEGVNDSKFQYSHFISLPLSMHPSLVQKLQGFQDSVLLSLGIPAVDDEKVAVAGEAEDVARENSIATEMETAQKEEISGSESMAVEVYTANGEEVAEVENATAEAKTFQERPSGDMDEGDAAVEEVFQRSVLGSLGIQPTETEDKVVDGVFKETVLTSLGIPVVSDNSQQATELESETEPLSACPTEDEAGIIAEQIIVNVGEETKPDSELRSEAVPETEEMETVAVEEDLKDSTDGLQGKNGNEEDRAVEQETEIVAVEETEPSKKERLVEEKGASASAGLSEEKADHVEEVYEPLPEVAFTTKKKKDSGVEKSIFIKPSRFHLTILMLKLWNEERVEKAREVLEKCLPDVAAALDGRPVSVSLRGLEIMRGSPKNTRVLYAKVEEADNGGRLSRACQVMIDAFVESGLVLGKDREQELKLHATVMNTSHRRSKSRYKNKGFDATEILAKFAEESWGDYQIMEAHLSERFKYDDNDFYHCCGCIKLPGNDDAKPAEGT